MDQGTQGIILQRFIDPLKLIIDPLSFESVLTIKLLGGPGADRLMNLGSIPYCESMFARLVEECEARFE